MAPVLICNIWFDQFMKILKDRALLCPDCGSKFFSLQKCLRYVEEQSDYQQQKKQNNKQQKCLRYV